MLSTENIFDIVLQIEGIAKDIRFFKIPSKSSNVKNKNQTVLRHE